MADPDLVLRSTRVVTPEGVAARSIQIRGGTIISVKSGSALPLGTQLVDVDDAVILPGLVVERTYLRGELVFEHGAMVGAPRGRTLMRTEPHG